MLIVPQHMFCVSGESIFSLSVCPSSFQLSVVTLWQACLIKCRASSRHSWLADRSELLQPSVDTGAPEMLGRRCHGVRGLVSTGLGKRVVDLPLLCLVGRRASVSVGGSVGGWTDIGGMNDGWMLAPWVAKAHHPHALPLPTTHAPRVFLRAIEEQEKRGRGAAQSEEKSDILFSYSRKLSRLELARCFRLLFVGYLMESGSQCKICSPISSARLQRRRSIAAVGLGSRPGSRVTFFLDTVPRAVPTWTL